LQPEVIIAGLGPGDPDLLPPGVLKILKQGKKVFLRTGTHPVVPWLREQGCKFLALDYYYEQEADFESVYRRICRRVLEEARHGQVVYAVPGHPMVAERSVELIIKQLEAQNIQFKIMPAMSFLDAVWPLLGIDPLAGVKILDGLDLKEDDLDPAVAAVIAQVHSRLVAADVKITLLERYPADHRAVLVRAAGVPGQESVKHLPLYELDRVDTIDHLTTVYLPPLPGKRMTAAHYPLDPLVNVLAQLRDPDGCPWDREQDHGTLARYLLEESHEALEAIRQGNMYKICEELGDLLLQIVFHAQIASENGHFDINDIVAGITEKMVRRHPHVFGNIQVAGSEEVMVNWDRIKQIEKGGSGQAQIIPPDTGKGWPALMRAGKVQELANKVGFDWPDYHGALDKTREELAELSEALAGENRVGVAAELGDLLFAVVNLARLLKVDAETALLATIDKFVRRFAYIEALVSKDGGNWKDYSLERLDALWDEAKKQEM
jgi:tetrapyrrole methylase family protein/MazG family protein